MRLDYRRLAGPLCQRPALFLVERRQLSSALYDPEDEWLSEILKTAHPAVVTGFAHAFQFERVQPNVASLPLRGAVAKIPKEADRQILRRKLFKKPSRKDVLARRR
jgi:hypothetical protein